MSSNIYIYCLIFLLSFCLPLYPNNPNHFKINIFSYHNGKGLEKSQQILKEALEELGHEVTSKKLQSNRLVNEPLVDINIFFENINTSFLQCATKNWFIPNPECFSQNLDLLDSIDLILCRTHEVERIFKSLNKPTYYLGFTGNDCFLSSKTSKDYSSCLHAAGGSPYKGTSTIIEAWKDHHELPFLTVISHLKQAPYYQNNLRWISKKLPPKNFRLLQNSCGIHLCVSDTEGFGHYLVEALSTYAVVITTDAPPMNEYVTDKRCLVAYNRYYENNLATRYVADPQSLETTIKNIMGLSKEELIHIGKANRAKFEQKTAEFHTNLRELLMTK